MKMSESNLYDHVLDANISATDLTNSMKVLWGLLEEKKLIIPEPLYGPECNANVVGHALEELILSFFKENVLSTEEDFILLEEHADCKDHVLCTDECEDDEFSDIFEPPANSESISLEYKKKVVAFAALHPKYTIKSLNRVYPKLKRMDTLRKWQKDIENGGTFRDKVTMINAETFARFEEARKNHEQVTTRTVQQWAMGVAFPLLNEEFNFIASQSWVKKFKR